MKARTEPHRLAAAGKTVSKLKKTAASLLQLAKSQEPNNFRTGGALIQSHPDAPR
jgi:hypothetical protein